MHVPQTTADTIRGVSPDSDADGAPPKPGHGVKVGQPAGKAAKDAKDTSKVKDTKEATKDTARDEAKQTTEGLSKICEHYYYYCTQCLYSVLFIN